MMKQLNNKRSVASRWHLVWLAVSLAILTVGLVLSPFKGVDYVLVGASLVSILGWIAEINLDQVDRYMGTRPRRL